MKKVFYFAALFSLLAATGFATTQVNAQSTGLAINPRQDITVDKGKTVSGKLYVRNLNSQIATTVTLNVIDFKAANETGSPALQLQENAPQTPWSLKPFINLPKTVDLKPGEAKYVTYSVRIPANQGAGSYYSAIKYDPRASGNPDSVLVTGAPTQLLFVTVPGKATELMNLKEFGAYDLKDDETTGKYKSLYVAAQPQRFAYLLQNVGNVAESPSGSIIIKNIFGKQVKIIENANPKRNLALIDQTRRFDVCIDGEEKEVEQDGRKQKVEVCKDPGLLPGIYRAQLSVFYGINGSSTQEINAVTTFWYMPFWFIGVILLFLAVLAFVIYKLRKSLIGAKIHRRNRR